MATLQSSANAQDGAGLFDFVFPSEDSDLIREPIPIKQNGGAYEDDLVAESEDDGVFESDEELGADSDEDLVADSEDGSEDDSEEDEDDEDVVAESEEEGTDDYDTDNDDSDDSDYESDDESDYESDEPVQEGRGQKPSLLARAGLGATLVLVTVASALMGS